MKLGNPIRIAEGVFQLRALGARVTVLTANGEALLIDAGMKGSSPLILGGLQAMGLSLDAVKALVITHRHPDHAAGRRGAHSRPRHPRHGPSPGGWHHLRL